MKQLIIMIISSFFFLSAMAGEKQEDKRPNIIFLLADDLIYDGLGCMGRKDMKTPNLDKLGKAGAIFTKAYNTTAICMASRASIMTGMYEFSTGCNFVHGDMENDIWQKSYPNILKKNGYKTGFGGKFGFRVNKPDGSKGKTELVKEAFDWWCGWLGQGSYDMNKNKEAEEYIKAFGNDPEHTTFALGKMGSQFIAKYAKGDEPFCLSISFKAPHTPYWTDPRYNKVFEGHIFEKPENYGKDKQIPEQAKSGRPYSKGAGWMKDYQGMMENYHKMVYGMDVAIGLIVKELEKQGVAENTVIIFTSDNGHFNGSKALGGKLYAYEEGSKTPMIYFDPRLPEKKHQNKIDALTATIDIAPTVLELAGIEIPENMQGNSLLPLVEKGKKENHESLLLMNVWGTASAQSLGVVTKDWKYIHWFYGADGFTPTEELYNYTKDKTEDINLVTKSEYASTLQKMQAKYDEWLQFWEEQCVDGNGYPKYVQLGNRSIPFSEHSPEMILDMYNDPKAKKDKNAKKDNSKKKKENQ